MITNIFTFSVKAIMSRRPRSATTRYGNVSEKCYFESYARTSIHRDMIKDRIRTQTYRDAMYHNKHLFKDKTVLDVGCGTGILSLFAARAGAKKVIGVEFSDFAIAAKKVVRDNNMTDTVTIGKYLSSSISYLVCISILS